MKNKMKLFSNRGVTIVVLIITIVVSLILVGISISMVRNSDGIVEKAKLAEELSYSKEERERVDEAWVKYQAYYSGGSMTFEEYLDENGYDWEVEDGEGDYEGYYIVTIENGNKYEIKKEKEISASDTVEVHKHTFDDSLWEVVEANCTESQFGTKTNVCTECGETVIVEIPPVHNFGKRQVVKAPSCSEEGYSARVCSECGEETDIKSIDKTSHTFGVWKKTDMLDANGRVLMRRTCENCNYSETKQFNGAECFKGDWYVGNPKIIEGEFTDGQIEKFRIFKFIDDKSLVVYNTANDKTVNFNYQLDFENHQIIAKVPEYLKIEFDKKKQNNNYQSPLFEEYLALGFIYFGYNSEDGKCYFNFDEMMLNDEYTIFFTLLLNNGLIIVREDLSDYFSFPSLGTYYDENDNDNYIAITKDIVTYRKKISSRIINTSNSHYLYYNNKICRSDDLMGFLLLATGNLADDTGVMTVDNNGNIIFEGKTFVKQD